MIHTRMNFAKCITSSPAILMEGALGERVKREFNINIDGTMAMAETNIPYIISFTIQADGKLIDGHSIDFAIKAIDNSVSNKPIGYMTNCVHPTIAHKALLHPFNKTKAVQSRFIGIQGNTSALSYSELDGASDLKKSSPSDFADDTMKLVMDCNLQIVGGCCGTNGKHMEEIAKRLKNEGKQPTNF